jgi:hypothetical protein
MKIKIECEIEVDDSLFPYHNEFPEEKEFFDGIMEDMDNTFVVLHSNEIGDEIGRAYNFKYEIWTDNRK